MVSGKTGNIPWPKYVALSLQGILEVVYDTIATSGICAHTIVLILIYYEITNINLGYIYIHIFMVSDTIAVVNERI